MPKPTSQNRFCQRCGKAVPAEERRVHLKVKGPTGDAQEIKVCQACDTAIRVRAAAVALS